MAKKIYIFLIIFLIVFGFLAFHFKKTEKIEAVTNTWQVSAGSDDIGVYGSTHHPWEYASLSDTYLNVGALTFYQGMGVRFKSPPTSNIGRHRQTQLFGC